MARSQSENPGRKMRASIRIRRDAERDIRRLYAWYERRSSGLGPKILEALENAYLVLEENPLLYADVHRGTRRVVLRNFPIAVYFKIVDTRVHVIGVDHCARDPELWRKRT